MAGRFTPGGIDFSPLLNIIPTYQKQAEYAKQQGIEQTRRDILGRLMGTSTNPDWNEGARALLAAGDYEGGLKLAALASAERKANAPDWRGAGNGGVFDANSPTPPSVIYGGGSGFANPQFVPGSTPDQSKAQGFYKMGAEANAAIDQFGSTVNTESARSAIAGSVDEDAGMGLVGKFARSFVDPEAQQLKDAGKAFLAAITYRDSGANVSDKEYRLGQAQYLPRAGDDDATLTAKAQRRKAKLETIQGQGGPMFNPAAAPPPPSPGKYQDGQTATNPQTGQRILFQNGAWVPVR
jgi:hypothetical protein